MFSKETFVSRRKKLIEATGSGLLLFIGNDESPMNYADNTFRYRQDSSFLYYFGLNHADLCATIDADSGETVIYGEK